jgi:hypothetical protein
MESLLEMLKALDDAVKARGFKHDPA